MFLSTGLRVGEVSALLRAEYSLDEHMLRVRRKGGRHRLALIVVPYSQEIQKRYLDVGDRVSEPQIGACRDEGWYPLHIRGMAELGWRCATRAPLAGVEHIGEGRLRAVPLPVEAADTGTWRAEPAREGALSDLEDR